MAGVSPNQRQASSTHAPRATARMRPGWHGRLSNFGAGAPLRICPAQRALSAGSPMSRSHGSKGCIQLSRHACQVQVDAGRDAHGLCPAPRRDGRHRHGRNAVTVHPCLLRQADDAQRRVIALAHGQVRRGLEFLQAVQAMSGSGALMSVTARSTPATRPAVQESFHLLGKSRS